MSPKLAPQRKKTILVLSPEKDDCETIAKMLGSNRWYKIVKASTVAEAKELMPQASVVVCEACLPDGSWQQVLEMAQNEEEKNQPLVVVCRENADERLWSEVLNCMAYDVLAKPFDREEVFRIISSAVRHQSEK